MTVLLLAEEPGDVNIPGMSNEERAAVMPQDEIVALLASHQSLQQQLDWFKRQMFGAKSERHIHLDYSRQLTLGELPAGEVDPAPSVEVPAHRRTKARAEAPDEGTLRFDDSVPVVRTELPPDIPEEELDQYEQIGEKTNRLLAQTPGQFFVHEYVRPVYKKKAGPEAIEDKIIVADPPRTIFQRSFADVSLLAGIWMDKFRYHLPLYRQHQRMTASGIHISPRFADQLGGPNM